MQKVLFLFLLAIFCFGCKKDKSARVDIYLLKAFTTTTDRSTSPATISITNAVLESLPLVDNSEIERYTAASSTFLLTKDIQAIIGSYGPDKGFAVTVDNQPIYYGKFHPLYLSSITFGLATIGFISTNKKELPISFATIVGSGTISPLDKRNDSRILDALRASGRLR